MSEKIIIGISECLLGCKVRFDGGHKHDRYITDTLGRYFEFKTYCPEVAIGMGVPREPIRLVGDPQNPSVLGVKNSELDVTVKLKAYSQQSTQALPSEICGFILKSKSPTCGMERVKVYHANGNPNASAKGIFAKALAQNHPSLPIEEEGRLCDPMLRENFIQRVFIMKRWKNLLLSGATATSLIAFHSQHKLSLMAHHPVSYKLLGAMLSNLKDKNIDNIAADYISQLMTGFKYIATRAKTTNLLQHCVGYLKKQLDKEDKAELQKLIQQYRLSNIPLVVPITLLRHYFRKYPDEYMLQQTFLSPYPNELNLRNVI
jgi:uncharacterized protein YbgA (DUF1722 family)/uncharacterized protein YbbK (DUF523 family)